MYDLIIKNGNILDGSGKAAFVADIAIAEGKIAAIGSDLQGAAEIIDATGLTVSPGFIDSHSHADTNLSSHPEQIEKSEQGITTSVGGQCGSSPAPSADQSFSDFVDHYRRQPLGANIALFLGHNTLRKLVMGMDDRDPTADELSRMCQLVTDAVSRGALGISFGLTYMPGNFAKMEELVCLATAAAKAGGMISAHIRDEGDHLEESCREFIEIAKASGARGIISHHKAAYRQNWGKVSRTLAMIDEANRNGCDIYMDTYPYTASHTSVYAKFIPKKYYDGGVDEMLKKLSDPAVRQAIRQSNLEIHGDDDLRWVLVTVCPAFPEYTGKRLPEIAQLRNTDVYDVIFDMIVANRNNFRACYFLMCEEDLQQVLRHERCMVCTDSGVRTGNSYHPRLRGSFPRVLGRYVRQLGILSLPEMIRKSTSLPAAVYGFKTKGLLKEGYDADICIFDPETIIDRCDFVDCHQRADGLRYVLIGGKVVAENAEFNGTMAGKLLV